MPKGKGLFDGFRKKVTGNPGANLHGLLKSQHEETLRDSMEGWQLEVITQDHLFDAFMRNSVDYKGQLCSGYSEHGYGAKADVSFDFGEILCPGLTASVSGSVGGERARYFLLIVGRQPRSLERMTTINPICLLCLDGASTKIKVSLGGEIGIKTPEVPGVDLPECASFTLEAGATASAEVAYTATRLFLRDPSPRFYPSWNDTWLKADFSALIGPGGKREIKEDMLAFFDADPQLKQFKPEKGLFTKLSGGHQSTKSLETALRKALALVQSPHAYPDATMRTRLANKISYLLAEMQAFKSYDANFFLGVRKTKTEMELAAKTKEQGTKVSAEDLLRRDSKLCFLDLWSHQPEANAGVRVYATASFEVELGATTLVEGQKESSEDGGDGGGDGGSESSDTEDGGEPDPIASIDWGVKAGVGAEAEAKVGIEGSYKHTAYRYQTFMRDDHDPTHLLVATQDTVITYKQIVGSASLNAKLYAQAEALGREIGKEVPLIGRKKNPDEESGLKKEKVFLNAMSYTSAIVYWNPVWVTGRPGPIDIKAETGSGFSFGQSAMARVLVQRIAAYCRNPQFRGVFPNPDPAAAAYLRTLAASLRVSLEDLVIFLNSCRNMLVSLYSRVGADRDQAVLIESSFASPGPGEHFMVKGEIPGGDPARIRLLSDGHKGSFRRAMIKAAAGGQDKTSQPLPNLQAMRIRVRRADTLDKSAIKFKLGFEVLGTGIGIELTGVDRAGSEGIADLWTYWFPPYHSYNIGGASRGRPGADMARFFGHEAAVPPVALLHQ